CDQSIQGLRRVLGTVMAEYDGAVSEMLVLCHSLDDGIHTVILPVQRITVRYKSKDKFFKGNFTEILRCFSKKKILFLWSSILISFS
ncbi:MAG: hypothetical protein J6J23_07050, partial [Clostridia bacterium]|nr:hypothetical protein [Clostridia bacterium]